MKGSKEKEKYDDNENDEKIWRIVRRVRKGSGRKKKKNEN